MAGLTYPEGAMTQTPQDPAARRCVPVLVPSGQAGVAAVLPPLADALAGSGSAIAPLPTAGPDEYLMRLRRALRPNDPVPGGVAAVLATSGSTGDPAGVLLPAEALRAAAEGFAARFGQHRWVAALPLHHAGGFMVLVRSLVDGTVPVPVASLGGAGPFTVEAFADATRAALSGPGGDRPLAVSLVPAMLHLLDSAGDRGRAVLAEYDVVLVGGAAPPAPLVNALRDAGVSVITSYGMTETCGGIAFDGQPLPASRVRADDQGRLLACGAQVAAGYRDGRQPERWTVEDGLHCFRTDDLGEVDPQERVRVTGRVDDVVQVSGASVSLRAIAGRLRADAAVSDAEVVAVPDDRFGASIVAFVVAEDGAPGAPAADPRDGRDPNDSELGDLRIRLAARVADALGRAARPWAVALVDAIPMLESGKPDRARLQAQARVLLSRHDS
jgi:O-succinylbenzoic acid--CoA ligase